MKKQTFLLIAICVAFLLGGANQVNAQTQTASDGVFKVKVGFHCANGKRLLETKLAEVKGVEKVEVNLETKEVSIKHNPDVVSSSDLVKAIENIGYYTELSDKTKPLHKKACDHDGEHH